MCFLFVSTNSSYDGIVKKKKKNQLSVKAINVWIHTQSWIQQRGICCQDVKKKRKLVPKLYCNCESPVRHSIIDMVVYEVIISLREFTPPWGDLLHGMFGLLFLLSLLFFLNQQEIYVFSRNKRMKEMYNKTRANKKKTEKGVKKTMLSNGQNKKWQNKNKKKLFQWGGWWQ